MNFVLTVIGLGLLVGAGDALVRGAVALSLRLGVPVLIISLTVVAFGTSAPELVVGVEAALADADGIAFGNVVGSNIANILLVLGLPALIAVIRTELCDSRRSWIGMVAASLLFIVLCHFGPLVWWHGLVLLAGLVWMLADAWAETRKAQAEGADAAALAEIEDVDPHMAPWKVAGLLLAGIVGLPIGAHLLIDGARGVALAFGLSEAAIGLTLVAVGTSLPELMTSVMAALRKQAEVAIGNVVGSNLFNLLGIMGVVSFFGPLDVPPEFLRLDLWVMLGCSLLLIPAVFPRWPIGWAMGAGFVALYVVYGVVVLGPRV